jgi:antitoxin Phd
MRAWQLQDAKAHFSQLVREAVNGPQQITLHGKAVVVIITQAEYDKLTQPKISFVQWIRQSPWMGVELDIQRDKTLTRDEDFGA